MAQFFGYYDVHKYIILKTEKNDTSDKKTEDKEELKKETNKTDPVHKGYNEKNPEQPQGAFKPDSKDGK